MKNSLFFIIIMILTLVLTGCWGAKKIEGEVYVTALGLDYRDGNFIVYIQGLNFGNIAKQEGGRLQEMPILIGEAKGETIQLAYGALEKMSAMPLSMGHVETVILSKRVMKEKMADVIDIMGQSPNLRYSLFLFGTDENLKKLLQTQSFFDFPQLFSMIHQPDKLIQQNYSLPIIRYNQFVSRFYQEIGTILIPSLAIDKSHFSEGKDKKIAALNGEYLISQQQYKGWLSIEDLSGMRWFSKGIQEFTVRVATKKKVAVRIKNPKTNIMVLKGKQPSYRVVVKGRAELFQNAENKTRMEMEKELNKKIKNDIVTTIKKGDKLNTDVLNISEPSFKYHLNDWGIGAIRRFNINSIKEIQVKIHIMESGKYK